MPSGWRFWPWPWPWRLWPWPWPLLGHILQALGLALASDVLALALHSVALLTSLVWYRSLDWTILSHVSCFIQGEVVVIVLLLQIFVLTCLRCVHRLHKTLAVVTCGARMWTSSRKEVCRWTLVAGVNRWCCVVCQAACHLTVCLPATTRLQALSESMSRYITQYHLLCTQSWFHFWFTS